jgi:uncharacterized protein (DUF1800 family)
MPRVSLRVLGVLAAIVLSACSGARESGNATPPSAPEASRFLNQASFGATDAEIAKVRAAGYSLWIDQQMVLPPRSHLAEVNTRLGDAEANTFDVHYSFWNQAITGPDQLRQRVKLAYSEIFVISMNDSNVDERGAASFYDMLGTRAFGNFRTLLEDVTLHPMMGVYLTWLGNQKEDPATGRKPDENYAREVMQLMTIGLYQLNLDGTVKTDGSGRPIPTYTTDDIAGLAKVFTGFSYYSPRPTTVTFGGRNLPTDAKTRAMIAYPQFHSTSGKAFLGVAIPATTTPDPEGELKVALDTLFNHPNVGPFVGRQLIQRLVTSNPSPAYVARVATVFNDNGKGVRGDMAAVIRAILLDEEARSATVATGVNYGKVREPMVRLAHWARAFGATSQSGAWMIPTTSANTSLGQSVLSAPSVFNFYRPGYSPPNTRVGAAGLVGPEMQIVDEVTVAGYLNTMQSAISIGTGQLREGVRDVGSNYAAEVALANDPEALVDRVDLLLMAGRMSPGLRKRVVDAVAAINVPAPGAAQSTALANRAKLAIFLTMASSEYLVQR